MTASLVTWTFTMVTEKRWKSVRLRNCHPITPVTDCRPRRNLKKTLPSLIRLIIMPLFVIPARRAFARKGELYNVFVTKYRLTLSVFPVFYFNISNTTIPVKRKKNAGRHQLAINSNKNTMKMRGLELIPLPPSHQLRWRKILMAVLQRHYSIRH